MTRPVRIAFLLERDPSDPGAPALSAVTREVVSRLTETGDAVDLSVPETELLDLERLVPRHDLYVLKEKSPLNLSIAGALTAAGATVVNSYRASGLTRDKVAATMALAGAGIPVPPSWSAGRASLFAPLLGDGPVWVKTARGSQGAGVRRVSGLETLGDEAPADAWGLPLALLAQREAPSAGSDLKVYVVGEDVWAIRRVYPARTLEEKRGTSAPVPEAIRRIALACGRALGLELYGIDFLLDGESVSVVDVNALPGYKGIAEAPAAMASYFHARALLARSGRAA